MGTGKARDNRIPFGGVVMAVSQYHKAVARRYILNALDEIDDGKVLANYVSDLAKAAVACKLGIGIYYAYMYYAKLAKEMDFDAFKSALTERRI